MEKGTYKIFQIRTTKKEKENRKNRIFFGELKLPKDVEFLSFYGKTWNDALFFDSAPILLVSILGDFSKPSEFINYHFMLVERNSNDDEYELPLDDGYQYLNQALSLQKLSHYYDDVETQWRFFDVFVKKS